MLRKLWKIEGKAEHSLQDRAGCSENPTGSHKEDIEMLQSLPSFSLELVPRLFLLSD